MRTARIARYVVIAAVALGLAAPQVAGQRRRGRDDDHVNRNRLKMAGLLDEARKLGLEAGALTREAVRGKIPDRTKPAKEGQKKEDRWIELTTKERLDRFAKAKKKFDASFRKVGEVEKFLKTHPDIIRENIPAEAKKKLQRACAMTLVAETRFRMSENLGAITSWRKLASQALKIDKECLEAQRLDKELKDMAAKKEKEDTNSGANKDTEKPKKE
ncbi:MAG: hypothetical protein GWP05_06855 [Anaerolineaceae bacterium]|nr:hypothetical protein [Anaerolineaceae bacterium]